MTDPTPIIPEPTPLHYATREEIARTPSLFTDSVAGALNTHALYCARNLTVPEEQTAEDLAMALAVLENTDQYIRSVLRMVLHASEQAALVDVTALTDAEIIAMVQTVWPVLVQIGVG